MTGGALRAILPRVVLALLFVSGSALAFFESVYLSDQAQLIGDPKIAFWMWAFRVIAVATLLGAGIILFRQG